MTPILRRKGKMDAAPIDSYTIPITSYTIPPIYHRHIWRLYVVTEGAVDDVIARCDDCPAEMDKTAIEAILNGVRTLTDAD
jgi:hypothetical protein